MTQVERGRLNYGLRECRLYRFYVLHPITGETVLGYIGETGRQPFERLLEHLATQPWFDTVVRWEVDPQVYWGKDAVLAAEAAAIRAEKPLYNVKGNERNRDRIIPPEAIRQRRARDAARGGNRWVHPDDRPAGQSRTISDSTGRPGTAAKARTRSWRPWQKQVAGWTGAWAVATVALWIVEAVRPEDVRWFVAPAVAAGLTLFVRVWSWLGYPLRPRTWGRQWRRKRAARARGRRR